jgi:uncharacterized protein YndB with AHSA1/START domain
VAAIVTSAEIERPAAEVFACATDPALFSKWQCHHPAMWRRSPGSCCRPSA